METPEAVLKNVITSIRRRYERVAALDPNLRHAAALAVVFALIAGLVVAAWTQPSSGTLKAWAGVLATLPAYVVLLVGVVRFARAVPVPAPPGHTVTWSLLGSTLAVLVAAQSAVFAFAELTDDLTVWQRLLFDGGRGLTVVATVILLLSRSPRVRRSWVGP